MRFFCDFFRNQCHKNALATEKSYASSVFIGLIQQLSPFLWYSLSINEFVIAIFNTFSWALKIHYKFFQRHLEWILSFLCGSFSSSHQNGLVFHSSLQTQKWIIWTVRKRRRKFFKIRPIDRLKKIWRLT